MDWKGVERQGKDNFINIYERVNMANEITTLKKYLKSDGVLDGFKMIIGDHVGAFTNSIINLVSQSDKLQKCSPESIIVAAKRAATLGLLIDRSLGFAAIVPYGNEAQFQMQYKGYIQLAIRTGNYRGIDALEIYADELESYNRITNELLFTPQMEHKQRDDGLSEHIVGYYGWFELHTGFRCERFISHKEALRHAKAYSNSYQYDLSKNKKKSVWTTNPTAMGIKTVLKMILGTYGLMSIEMQEALSADNQSFDNVLNDNAKTVQSKQGSVVVDVKPQPKPEPKKPDPDDEFALEEYE